MHNPEPVMEDGSHKLLWDCGIQTDHLISDRRPDQLILNKKEEKKKQKKTENLPNRDLFLDRPQSKTKRKQK